MWLASRGTEAGCNHKSISGIFYFYVGSFCKCGQNVDKNRRVRLKCGENGDIIIHDAYWHKSENAVFPYKKKMSHSFDATEL